MHNRASTLEAENRRFRAMFEAGFGSRFGGGEPEVPEEIQHARNAFAQVFPGIAKLEAIAPMLGEIVQALQQGNLNPRELFSRIPDAISSADHGWARHGRTTLNSIASEIAKDYGVQALSPRQRALINQDFLGWVREDEARMDRYADGDPALTQEYIADYRQGFVAPLRVSTDAAAAAAAARNRGLPPAPRNSGVPGAGVPPAAVPTEDQVHDNAWNMMTQGRR